MKLNFILLLINGLFSMFPAYAHNDSSLNLKGDWEVKNVYVSTNISRRPDLIPEDPNLVGRTVNFKDSLIKGGGVIQGCQFPTFTKKSPLLLDSLVALTAGEEPNDKAAKEYDLPLAGNTKVTPYLISCKSGFLGPRGQEIGNWLIKYDDDKILTNWFNQTYLLLEKLPAKVTPTPSFDCKKATSKTEKAICSDYELSSWDRSVTLAYSISEQYIKGIGINVKKELEALKLSQRNWLKGRDSCGDNTQCISDKMQSRVSVLVEAVK
ncbi:hypothetical protein EJP617_04730 [Erwinia sp. Ejp617]|nr:lysozyme inhibitor LprI family protein [Erwinia sp. Ejp617]ADP10154.1 hypothetical protein EJP617_04730 [Erwinia sp. Ejp617]